MIKVVKLVDRRACAGRVVRELRKTIRQIESGEITDIAIAAVHRDGNVHTYFDADSAVKALGATELLRNYIIGKRFKDT